MHYDANKIVYVYTNWNYMFNRAITAQIEWVLWTGKIILVLGPRQVGKTTLINTILAKSAQEWDIVRLHGEYSEDYELLNSQDFGRLTTAIGHRKWIFIDEGQKIPNIWNTLKILIDHYKNTRNIFVSGSSSIHLLSHTAEPLTGRKRVFTLFPLSFWEISDKYGVHETDRKLEEYLTYGSYPGVINMGDIANKKQELLDLSSSALYRDILEFQDIRNPQLLTRLLKIIAIQIWQEVSLSALGQEIGMDSRTVERYIDLLEKSFIIFRLPPYYTNKMKEITKMQKIYFYDIGMRNALLGQYNPIEDRVDKWAIWENYIISERKRARLYRQDISTEHFWRGKNQQEIDLIENTGDTLRAIEIKWKEQKSKLPSEFVSIYGDTPFSEIHTKNYIPFLITP